MDDLLMVPGPTPLPPEVRAALTLPMVNHRSAPFRAVEEEVQAGLRQVFETTGRVFVLPAAGTGGLEAAIQNLVDPGQTVLSVTQGSFGDRWATLARAFGAQVETLASEWGSYPRPEALAERLAADHEHRIRVILLTHNETSTGVLLPLEAMVRARGNHPALILVDAVSSLAATALPMDAWGIDCVVAGSQKALMTPPGLAVLALSERAVATMRQVSGPRGYFDLRGYLKADGSTNLPYTPAVSLFYGLRASLRLILTAGLDASYARHERLGAMARRGLEALGLKLVAEPGAYSPTVTAAYLEGADEFRTRLRGLGVTLAGGQGKLTGRVVRIGHVGYINPVDMLGTLAAVEVMMGREHAGRAVAAAEAVLEEVAVR